MIVPVSGKRDPVERIRAAIAEPSQKPPDRSSLGEARPNGRNQSRNRRVKQNRQEDHGDEKRRNSKKTLSTAFFSDPIISSKHSTTATESYHKGAEPNQTKLLNKVALVLKINRICQTDEQKVNLKTCRENRMSCNTKIKSFV